MRRILRKVLLFAFCITSAISIAQNKGIITGKVTDNATGEVLIGAAVVIEGTTTGVAADINGVYSLKLDTGTYNLACSFISYNTEVVRNVIVTADGVVNIDFKLGTNTRLDEVVVETKQTVSSDMALITIQQRSLVVQDGISSQQISRTGSSNAAESMKQITGANIEDGKYMVMRGLGDRYSIAQLNGLTMTSSDPYRNSTSLDLIPSGMIDNLIAVKTFTPDQPGNFAGGNVNITTKTFPDRFNLHFSASASYNTQSSFISDFISSGGGKRDWLGYDDGTRSLPDILKVEENRDMLSSSTYLKARNPSESNDLLRDVFHQSSRRLSNDFIPEPTNTGLNSAYSFSMGNKLSLFKRTLGFTIGGNYSQSFSHYEDAAVSTFVNTNSEELFAYQDLKEKRSISNPQLGGLMNISYEAAKNSTVSMNIMYSNDAEKGAREQSGSFLGQVSDSRAVFETRTMDFTQRELLTYQVNGKHLLERFFNTSIDWAGSYGKNSQAEPDLKYFAYTTVTDSVDIFDNDGNFNGKELKTSYYMNNAEYSFPYHFFRELKDKQAQARVDITVPFRSNKGKVKFGSYLSSQDRSFDEYRFQLNNSGVSSSLNFTKFEGDMDAFFSYNNFGITDTLYNPDGSVDKYATGYHYINQVNNKNFYTGNQTVTAGYAMITGEVWTKLKYIAGARMEHTNIFVESRDTSIKPAEIKLTDVLPSLNLVYALNAKTNLRAAATQTIARPNLRELAPFEQFDTKNGFFNVGNPALKRTVIQNYDLRWERYPSHGELIAVSAYYKHFKDPIIRAFNPSATIPELSYVNVSNANVYGLEIEVRKKLGFIANALRDFSFSANFTMIRSVVEVPQDEIENSKKVDSAFNTTTRPFQGQPPYILNGTLSYHNEKRDLEAALSYNIAGRKLYSIALFATPDVYEAPASLLNFKIAKGLKKNFQLSISGKNLLNTSFRKSQVYRDKIYIAEEYTTGATYMLQATYKIK